MDLVQAKNETEAMSAHCHAPSRTMIKFINPMDADDDAILAALPRLFSGAEYYNTADRLGLLPSRELGYQPENWAHASIDACLSARRVAKVGSPKHELPRSTISRTDIVLYAKIELEKPTAHFEQDAGVSLVHRIVSCAALEFDADERARIDAYFGRQMFNS